MTPASVHSFRAAQVPRAQVHRPRHPYLPPEHADSPFPEHGAYFSAHSCLACTVRPGIGQCFPYGPGIKHIRLCKLKAPI